MTPKELMRQCRRDHVRRAELESVIAEGGVRGRGGSGMRRGGQGALEGVAGVMRDGTCGECVAYNSIMCDGVPVGHGVCMVDGECVDADSPQCSNAPASHAQPISDVFGGAHEQREL